mmetsp:Transcript_26217/g.43893  ORF Transcript_26217/g.43893 Transcript_26217/m.43893 type:complete len:271 (-) Transcript_26217:54-866(-)
MKKKKESRNEKKASSSGFLGDALYLSSCAAMTVITMQYDLADLVPGLRELEGKFELRKGVSDEWMLSLWPFFLAASILYTLLITVGVWYMEELPENNNLTRLAGKLLPVWSLIAWIFSYFALVRLGSAVLHHLSTNNGIYNTSLKYCVSISDVISKDGTRGRLAWVEFFCYSKPMEFIDTIFIVLCKKPVSRLHWIHHQLTMWYSWLCLVLFASPGIIFATVNAFVHTIMYCWYFFAAMKLKPSSTAIVVTSLQNIQMLVTIPITKSHSK